jgi:tetratricopeptide (TPR) repeat protein
MKRAASLAWDKKWSRAIQEYHKALDEFPQDVTVLTGLGLAYAETRQLDKALQMYKQAAELSPDSPEVIQRAGHMLERQAQWPEAANTYVLAADACLRQRDTAQAIELWKKATVLDPENLRAHQNLARAYESQGQARKAARQHLIMARVLHRTNRTAEAIEHCSAALELDPHNTEGREILDALERGLALPDGLTARLQPDAEGKRTLDSFVVFEDIELGSGALVRNKTRASPADVVRERSLTQMAEAVFAETADPQQIQANLLLAQAADFQARGLADKAMDAYSSAIRIGTDTLAVHFNLGLLYQERRDFARAVDHLGRTLSDPEFSVGAHFAIGECYYAWNKVSDALQYFLEALRIVDTQSLSNGHGDDLNLAYEQLKQETAHPKDEKTAHHLARSILSFMSSKGWSQRARGMREHLDHLAGGCILFPLAEILGDPEAEIAMRGMSQIQEFLKQDMLFTALEECFWVIQQAPYYLPLHLHMADILIREGKLEEAVQKYTTISETYRVRGELARAIAVYGKALEVAPMDVGVREQFVHLLIEAGNVDHAIEQYIALADAYYQLAQVNRAIEKYTEALRYAPRGDPDRHWEVNLLHHIGDIYMQRVNWQQAIRAYERIKREDSEDEKARSYLIDLYYKTGQREQALHELDELIDFYKDRKQPRELLSALQDVVRSRPDELAVHMRLAKLYLDMEMKEEAVAELDTVGEMQLKAGMADEAIRTVQAIIRLGPDDVAGYRQLLAQLKSQ